MKQYRIIKCSSSNCSIETYYKIQKKSFLGFWYNPLNIDAYTTEMKNLWNAWSDSINIVCVSLFIQDEGIKQMDVGTVLELVMEGLDDRGYPIPKDQVIKMGITKALKKMGIKRFKVNKGDDYYMPIRLIVDDSKDVIQRKLELS